MRKGLPHRCRRCGARRTWSSKRKTEPRCRRCNAQDWRVDWHRAERKDHEKQTCRDPLCVYQWPHSIYSPYCNSRPGGPLFDDATDWKDFYPCSKRS